ncbi:MAG: carbon storage regulator [Actinomycetota bacterium]|nr:carbon storage regulator [Actinomycetota bacterium]
MLVLTRRANQSIMIGDDVVVTVLDVRGDQVRIGIKAPRSVDVHREEVFVVLQRNGGRDHVDEPSEPSEPSEQSADVDVAVTEPDVIDLDHIDAVAETPAPVVASPE